MSPSARYSCSTHPEDGDPRAAGLPARVRMEAGSQDNRSWLLGPQAWAALGRRQGSAAPLVPRALDRSPRTTPKETRPAATKQSYQLTVTRLLMEASASMRTFEFGSS